jgi:hypothetical protein
VRLKVFKNRTPRRISGPRREEVADAREDCIIGSFLTHMLHQILFG